MYGAFFLNAFPLTGNDIVTLPGGKEEIGVHVRYLPEKFMKPGYGAAIMTLFFCFFLISLQAIRPEYILYALSYPKRLANTVSTAIKNRPWKK